MSSVWCVRQTAVGSFFFFFLSDESSELAEFSEISVRHLTALSRAPHWSWSRVAGAAPPPSRPPTPPPSTLDSRSCAPTLPHPETSPTLPLQKHLMIPVLHHTESVKCQPLRILNGSPDDPFPFPWPTPFIPRLPPMLRLSNCTTPSCPVNTLHISSLSPFLFPYSCLLLIFSFYFYRHTKSGYLVSSALAVMVHLRYSLSPFNLPPTSVHLNPSGIPS